MRAITTLVVCLGLTGCGGESKSDPQSGGGAGGGGGQSGGAGGAGGIGGTGGGECPPGAGACGSVCGLALVASGKLPDPIAPTARLTGPSVIGTDDGFAVGYREQDGSTLRALLLSLSDSGTLGTPSSFDLAGCSSVVPTDGTGLAYADGSGMLVTSLPNCGTGAGAVFIPFDSKGTVGAASGPKNAAFSSLTVAAQGSVAPATGKQELDFVYRVVSSSGDVVERVVMQGTVFKASVPIAHPFGDGPSDFGMVATSAEVRALLGSKSSGLELQIGAKTSDALQSAGTFALPAAKLAALAAWDLRAAVLIPTASGVSWHAYELGTGASELGKGELPLPSASALALAVRGNHMIAAAAAQKQIVVLRQAGAKTLPFTGTEKTTLISGELGNGASTAAFDGTHLALAAARNRVAVVWLTKHALEAGQPTGGWALLECNNP